jgi:hypothetical protein
MLKTRVLAIRCQSCSYAIEDIVNCQNPCHNDHINLLYRYFTMRNTRHTPPTGIDDFAEALTAFNTTPANFDSIRANSAHTPFIFANDTNMSMVIGRLATAQTTKCEGIRVAVLIGESYFTSMLPGLQRHADIIVFVDIDPAVEKNNKHLQESMINCKIRHDFLPLYLSETNNPILKEKFSKANMIAINLMTNTSSKDPGHFTASDLHSFLSSAERQLSHQFFLNNEARFNECREAAKAMPCVSLNLDLFDQSAVSRVAEIFKSFNAVVTVFNASNLYYHDADVPLHATKALWKSQQRFEKSMKILIKDNPDVYIIYSRYREANQLPECAIARDCQSMVEDYQRFIIAANATIVFTKYNVTDLKDCNFLFRSVAFNGDVDELAALVLFQNMHKLSMLLISINDCGPSRMTALHQAVRSCGIEKVDLLLTPQLIRGQTINLNCLSKEGKTPLHLAWDAQNLEIFSRLLLAGCDPYLWNNDCKVCVADCIKQSDDQKSMLFLNAITASIPRPQ